MNTKTITHDTPDGPLEVTVGEATVIQGMKRQMLQTQALTFLSDEEGQRKVPDDPEALGFYLLRRYTWPNCMACTVESSESISHQELTFERFCQLPELFVANWETAALELNPHWRLQVVESEAEEEEEKKDEPASSNE